RTKERRIIMPKQTPSACPSCGSALVISELKCAGCDTVVRGEFFITPLGNLSEEQLGFVKTFVLSRGNISEVESRLGISYPTVRAKLDEAIAAISGSEGKKMSKAEILDALESGKLTASEAIGLLRRATT
ncbi:MAG: DUF2089 domain-containing protein, partial [Candidatus Edwardsbacteria bacterium]|nr:DUF2089 domain-containing protein [Candidatus Edwardsbacteria bacterium]